MKLIDINEYCCGCGLCCLDNPYIKENTDGVAVPIKYKVIKNEDLPIIEKIISECPTKAISIFETSLTNKCGIAGVEEVIKNLKHKIATFKINEVKNSDIKFNANEYFIDVPKSKREYENFKFSHTVESIAKEEIDSIFFSEKVYRPILKNVFVEYTINKLSYYYKCDNSDNNIYYYYTTKAKELLESTYAEINDLLGGDYDFDSLFKPLSCYPDTNDYNIECLKNFDSYSRSSGIIQDFKCRKNTYSYLMNLKFDCIDDDNIFNQKWYFYDFDDLRQQYINDLKHSMNQKSDFIENTALEYINNALKQFGQNIKLELKAKVEELENFIKNINSSNNLIRSSIPIFNLTISDVGNHKYAVANILKEIMKIEISDAVKLCEKMPYTIERAFNFDEANKFKMQFEDAGANILLN